MKRLILICVALLLVVSMGMTAFASGGFVSSPSGNRAPRLRNFWVDSAECETELIITPYAKRSTLSDAAEEDIEDAYKEIKNNGDLTTLNAELGEVAKQLGVEVKYLSVSDLFDISYTGCYQALHEANGHGQFHIELEADTLDHFVALMHRNNDTWELVDNATVEGKVLSFAVDSLSPFAIVVDSEDIPVVSPGMGDLTDVGLLAMLAVVSGAAILFFGDKLRKLSAK